MWIQRIVCGIVGHKSFPKLPDPPKSPTEASYGTLNGSTVYLTGGIATYNGGYVSTTEGPKYAKHSVCQRCHGVYWVTEWKRSYLCDINQIPELGDYYKWRVRVDWEENQRKKNPTADKLFKQYQMSLKLGFVDNSPAKNVDGE